MTRPALDPLHDVVLLLPSESRSGAGGFLLRQEADSELRSAIVVAVGPGRWSDPRGERDPMDVEVGQRVIISSKAGFELRDGDTTFLVVHEREVLFIDRRG